MKRSVGFFVLVGRSTSSPDDLLVPRGLRARLWKTVVIDNNACALLQSWDKVLENLDGVLVALVVEDPAEEVDWLTTLVSLVYRAICERLTISALGSLWSVEIIALELDSLSQLALQRWR